MKKALILLSAVLLIALMAIPAFAEFELEDFTIPDTGVHFAFNGDAKDEFGNVTGELVGEPMFVEGRDGTANGAVYLDDDTQYIFIGKYVDADSYTAIFWCKVEDNTEHVFLCSSMLGSIRIIHDDATHVGSTINGVVDNISDYAAPREEWVMMAFVYADENMDIYANGEYQTSLAGALPLPFTLIGNEATEQKGWQSYPFLAIDDAWFYGRAFTADEVKNMYAEIGGTASASSGSLTEILAYDYKECGDNTNEELQYNHEDPDIKTALSLKPLDGVDPEGTWYDFDISVAGEGDVEFTFLYAAKDDRYMDVTFNGETKQVTCANTGNFQTFDQVSVTFSGVPAGTQTLRIAAPSDYSDSHKTPNIDIIWYGAPGAGAATSSDAPDYVTDGLAAWYDGANNAAGSQDKGATVWKDASGHGLDFEVELNDTNYWTDKAFHIDSTRNYLPDELVDLVNGDTYTLEFAAGELVYPATDWVSLIISDNDHFSLFIRVSNDNLEYKYNDANKDRPKAENGADLVNNSTVAIAFDINTQDCWMYVDGELVSENVPIDTNIADTLMLGHDDAKRIWSGDVYAMRFYDRVLTPEEIAKNAAADNARFRSDAAPAPFAALTPTSSPAAPAEPAAETPSGYPSSGESGNFMMGKVIGNETGWDGTVGSGAASAFDGDPATFFDPLGVADGYCGMEYDEPYILEKVVILSRYVDANWNERFEGAMIEGSNDGEEWETLWTSEEQGTAPDYYVVTEFENNYGYKMFRYFNDYKHGDVAEVEFYGTPGTAERPAEEPKAEEPVAEEPKTEEPVAEEPKTEEPTAEEPKTEEPAAETPTTDNKPAETAKSGCGSMIGGGFIVLVTILGSAWIAKRK